MVTYTLKKLESVLKRKVKTIKDYINFAEMKATKINGRYIIIEEDLKDFLDSCKV